jgi:hypothetical protein
MPEQEQLAVTGLLTAILYAITTTKLDCSTWEPGDKRKLALEIEAAIMKFLGVKEDYE